MHTINIALGLPPDAPVASSLAEIERLRAVAERYQTRWSLAEATDEMALAPDEVAFPMPFMASLRAARRVMYAKVARSECSASVSAVCAIQAFTGFSSKAPPRNTARVSSGKTSRRRSHVCAPTSLSAPVVGGEQGWRTRVDPATRRWRRGGSRRRNGARTGRDPVPRWMFDQARIHALLPYRRIHIWPLSAEMWVYPRMSASYGVARQGE